MAMVRIGLRHAVMAGVLAGLSACGGGGGGGDASSPAPSSGGTGATDTSPCATLAAGATEAIVRSDGALVGKQAAVGVLGCSARLARVQWTQTSGPSVALLSAQTQLIHFEPTVAGQYGFHVAYTDANGAQRSQDLTLAITAPATAAKAIVRNHQAVRMGGAASMRAWSPSGEAISSVKWEQLEGPTVSLQAVDKLAQQFVAPKVTRDSLLRFRATVNSASGSDTQEVLVVVEQYDQAPSNNTSYVWSDEHVSRVHAYRAGGPYADAIAGCVYDPALTSANACTMGRLPFLGRETGGTLPSVDQVMNRVVVSHDWQGANFERFLSQQDVNGDFRRMLMSTTAIVLGSHVRPSFYHPATGAIYLDADNLWLLPEERDTIDETPDYRSSFGNALAYTDLWRYVKDNARYLKYYDPQQRITRTMDDLTSEMAWLLYHELSHANDFLPSSQYASVPASSTAWGYLSIAYGNKTLESDQLQRNFPLTSTEMAGLGQVNFQGATATAVQRAYTADQVGAFFAADSATDAYAYSTSREDLAMTVEEFLMSSRLGVRRDVAFVPQDSSGADLSNVRWGQRGRIGERRLAPRVQQAKSHVVPWTAGYDMNALPLPQAFRVGESWTANLNLGPAASLVRVKAMSASDQAREWALAERGERLATQRAAAHAKVEGWLQR
jgi:hypothetical protein